VMTTLRMSLSGEILDRDQLRGPARDSYLGMTVGIPSTEIHKIPPSVAAQNRSECLRRTRRTLVCRCSNHRKSIREQALHESNVASFFHARRACRNFATCITPSIHAGPRITGHLFHGALINFFHAPRVRAVTIGHAHSFRE